MRFRSYIDGGERFMGPETSMEVQAALGSDIALAFDECTPFHVERDYTARSTERTHRWLDRCIDWQRANAPEGQLLYGIMQGGVYEDLRLASSERVSGSDVDGVAVGGSLGQEKDQMREVVGWALRPLRDEQPRHLLGIGDVDDILHAVAAGIDSFDCATPTRLGRHGTALVPEPGVALAARPDAAPLEREPRADPGGLPLPGVPRAHARLPALPREGGRAHRRAPDHAPQPHLHEVADGRDPGGRGGRRARVLHPGGAGRERPGRLTARY